MEISVIIPVYNLEEQISRCLESVMKNESNRYEVIVIDDGSTDRSGEICDEYACMYPCIKVIHKANAGLSSARNIGIDHAKGKYLMFLDGDDFIEDGCIDDFIELINNGESDVIVGRAWNVDYTGNIKEKNPTRLKSGQYNSLKYIENYIGKEKNVTFCAQFNIVKKSFIETNNLRFYEGILHEDELWTPQVLLYAESIYYTNICFYYHCKRKHSIMQSDNYKKRGESLLLICEELSKIYSKFPNSYITYLKNRNCMLYLNAVRLLSYTDYEVKGFDRWFPIKNAKSADAKIRSMLFLVAPNLYYEFYKKRFKNIERN